MERKRWSRETYIRAAIRAVCIISAVVPLIAGVSEAVGTALLAVGRSEAVESTVGRWALAQHSQFYSGMNQDRRESILGQSQAHTPPGTSCPSHYRCPAWEHSRRPVVPSARRAGLGRRPSWRACRAWLALLQGQRKQGEGLRRECTCWRWRRVFVLSECCKKKTMISQTEPGE